MNKSPFDKDSGEDASESKQTMLPKPLRTFSYFFFGIVILVGVLGWFASYGR